MALFGGKKQTKSLNGADRSVSVTECMDHDRYGCLWMLRLVSHDGVVQQPLGSGHWRRAAFKYTSALRMGARYMHAMKTHANYTEAVIYGGFQQLSTGTLQSGTSDRL